MIISFVVREEWSSGIQVMVSNREDLFTQILICWLLFFVSSSTNLVPYPKTEKSDSTEWRKKKQKTNNRLIFLSIHWGSGFQILFFLYSFLLAKPQTTTLQEVYSACFGAAFKIFDSSLLPHSGPRAHSQVQNNLERMMGWKYVTWLCVPSWAVGNIPCYRFQQMCKPLAPKGTTFFLLDSVWCLCVSPGHFHGEMTPSYPPGWAEDGAGFPEMSELIANVSVNGRKTQVTSLSTEKISINSGLNGIGQETGGKIVLLAWCHMLNRF